MAFYLANLRHDIGLGVPLILLEATDVESARRLIPDLARDDYHVTALPPRKAAAMLREYLPRAGR